MESVSFGKDRENGKIVRTMRRWRYEIPETWQRETIDGQVIGIAGLWIMGSKDSGKFDIHYSYSSDTDEFSVIEVDDSFFTYPPLNFDE